MSICGEIENTQREIKEVYVKLNELLVRLKTLETASYSDQYEMDI
mgnify:FL=1|tara:strand:- start:20961 stop:21095 length:135 start_codon:yes stop_codon:yes gene_type:complete